MMTVILLGYLIVINTPTTEATTKPTDIEDSVSENTENVEVEIEEEVEEVTPMFYELSDHERWVVEAMVMGEAGGESYTGKLLVAQCILNAAVMDDIPPSEVRTKYKYSGWNENISDDVKNAVSEVFDYGYTVVEEPILYFYSPKNVYSAWHETQKHIITEGGHKFFAEWED